MKTSAKIAATLIEQERQIARLGSSSQLGNSSVGGANAVPLAETVSQAAYTNDALPVVQDDAADVSEGVTDLQDTLTASDDDLDARLEDAYASLDDKAAEIADSMQDVSDAFDVRVDGISDDVETAIVAAGSAKSEAEAATDAARDAAGLAASKGETIYQVSAPTGSRASTANLWIDITPDANGVPKNTPNRYVDLGPDTITNALPNPAFRNGLTGYSVEPAITATQQTDGIVRVITKDGQSQSFVIGGIQNAPYTLVVVGRSFQGGRPAIYGGNPQGQQVPLSDAWGTYYVDITQTDTNGNLYLAVVSPGGEPTNGFDLRGLMLVPGTGYRGPYSDGTTAGWKWTGTADASASTYTGPKWVPVTDQKAIDAAAAASTATAAAQAAKDVATQANTAAGVAQQAASDANNAALAAANLAGGKGKVIYQASKPTGANAAVGNLWIRSSDNTPWAYDTSSSDWVQVTDKAATDAAAAAAAANQAAVAASNAAKAAQATADSKPLILYSSTAGPSGTAPNGTIWFLWDSAKNVAGQWLQSGTLASPVWTPQQIRSEVIANLDVAKLTAGSAAIADLVAQKIAAATGNFQTVNVSNLFVTSGATMSQAVIDYLFANVVQAKKITAGMIDVDSLNGITLTGAIVQTAASGKRVVLSNNRLNFYGISGTTAVNAGVIEGLPNGASGGLISIGPGTGTSHLLIGTQSLPVAGSAVVYSPAVWFDVVNAGALLDPNTGQSSLPLTGSATYSERSPRTARTR
ncbi:hypothetical protein QP157_06695 [Sphingomonas sp. LR61]|uniref:hypothetical protein n=1 Tax=Sphingomonas sp. LR61 TaxID=3050234 RepID=UPI002FE12929